MGWRVLEVLVGRGALIQVVDLDIPILSEDVGIEEKMMRLSLHSRYCDNWK